MFAKVDDLCLQAVNRVARRLQEEMNLTMPMILRQVVTATILATVLAIIATALMRTSVATVITLVFGVVTIGSFWRLLQRYAKDSEKDWNSDLARDYMVRAIGATEGQRRMRHVGLIFSIMALALSISIIQFRPFDLVDLTMLFLIFSTMGHMYFSCAEPKPPGSQRREFKLAYQNAP